MDDPHAIEAIGRRHEEGYGGWGRTDPCRTRNYSGGWIASTTDQTRPDLAWMVRYHPDHGHSVIVVSNQDMSAFHSVVAFQMPQALLFRFGGYWWDGTTWYRPAQVWDAADEVYFQRPVPSAVTITAGDLLQNGGTPARARRLAISDVDPQARPTGHWLDDLALWAAARDDRGLADNIVKLAAPELVGDQLLNVTQMADLAGIAPSTLRAYIARNENDVPLPQASVGRSDLWARPVVDEWVEARNRAHDAVTEAVSIDRDGSSLPVGVASLWTRFSQTFMSHLWERPDWRKRWTLRWRTETAVREVAKDLSWSVAASLDGIIPMQQLTLTVEHAVLDEIASGLELEQSGGEPIDWNETSDDSTLTKADWFSFGINFQIAHMLDWLIRHNPTLGGAALSSIIGQAQDRFEIPRQVTERTLETALSLDSDLDQATRDDFLKRVFASDT
ncbi:hypothetical protein ITP53_51680 [Nonomuraea sp. K274]|uniref:Uncharacterized protein n=1 Tax=Nonomuraea cypriaca TaxID=1187855 RepID=A0A931F751_9ACTN|nr:hypothetical protein [Nonomuraea cypriaca]MBF8194003.1 hypothetical protein [Nonomuraea cypriaca]